MSVVQASDLPPDEPVSLHVARCALAGIDDARVAHAEVPPDVGQAEVPSLIARDSTWHNAFASSIRSGLAMAHDPAASPHERKRIDGK